MMSVVWESIDVNRCAKQTKEPRLEQVLDRMSKCFHFHFGSIF